MSEDEPCVRCPQNGRDGKDGRPEPFKRLPEIDFCWKCASEGEREEKWPCVRNFLRCKYFDQLKKWEEAFQEAKKFMGERGYAPEDNSEKALTRSYNWLFLVNWENSSLTEKELKEKCLAFSNFKNANLRQANIQRSDLIWTNLEGADLWRAHLEYANLYATHLDNIDAFEAYFENADLRWSRLDNASLRHAKLKGVKLRSADFRKIRYDMRSRQFKKGIGDQINVREGAYRELASYWREQGYNEDEDWARVKMHRAKILNKLVGEDKAPDFEELKSPGIEEDDEYKKLKRKLIRWLWKECKFKGLWRWVKTWPATFLDKTSKFGTDVKCAIKWSLLIPGIFTAIYLLLNFFWCLIFKEYFLRINPGMKYYPLATDLYYSVVTFATLGYGDIGPKNLLGQILSIAEVIFGYTMLGVLVSVIARKMSR